MERTAIEEIRRMEKLQREKVHTRVAREHAFQLNHMCSDKRYSAWDFVQSFHLG